MNTVTEYLTFNLSGRVRREKLEGRDHLVVPTVMIVEGVLNGSNGPLLYPAAELAEAPTVWDHKPIVVGHPHGATACHPDVLSHRKVGVLLNTQWVAPKLRTEAWIDRERARSIDARIVERLEANKTIEVSTGLRLLTDGPAGEFRGKRYNATARRYRPDHLAILVDEVGACSIADGAGMLALNRGAALTEDEVARILKMLQPYTGPPVLKPVHQQQPLPRVEWDWSKEKQAEIRAMSVDSGSGPRPLVDWKW